jgi:hypothetical protein
MKVCYFCGEMANSKEHLPPKQIFKGFKINRITVPSCYKHNTDKSGEDEAIVKAMLLSIENSDNKNYSPELLKALNIVKGHYGQVKRTVTEERLYSDYNKNIVCLNSLIDLNNWIKELSAGMIYYKTNYFDKNNDFLKSQVFERNSYSKNTMLKLSDFENERKEKIKLQNLFESGIWNAGWIPQGFYPRNLYYFEYRIIGEKILIKHKFYTYYTYYNMINLTDETRKKLL